MTPFKKGNSLIFSGLLQSCSNRRYPFFGSALPAVRAFAAPQGSFAPRTRAAGDLPGARHGYAGGGGEGDLRRIPADEDGGAAAGDASPSG